MAPLLILGTHVFAEEVADLVTEAGTHELSGFVENQDRDRCEEPLLGLPVHWIDDLAPLARDHEALCAIGTTKRRAYIEQVAALGFSFATPVHPSATISATSALGAGTVAGAGVIVAAHTTIGSHVILNRGVLVGHHTNIGSYVTVSPGANVAGLVTIGDGAYIGMGALVLDRRSVGAGAVVAAGSIVTRDVPPNTLVMGAPARVVRDGVEGR
jgi:sugar O-acyltransferase (sialic acid O-acetyltransferase NeuD family)